MLEIKNTTGSKRLLLILQKYKGFITFSFIGFISAAIDITFLYLFHDIFSFELYISQILSFILASINGFLMNRAWTFEKTDSIYFVQYIKFLIVSVIGLIFTLILLYFFVEIFSIWYIFSKILTIGIVVIWNYQANKLWAFKKTSPSSTQQTHSV